MYEEEEFFKSLDSYKQMYILKPVEEDYNYDTDLSDYDLSLYDED